MKKILYGRILINNPEPPKGVYTFFFFFTYSTMKLLFHGPPVTVCSIWAPSPLN